jgi:hypothetical protein
MLADDATVDLGAGEESEQDRTEAGEKIHPVSYCSPIVFPATAPTMISMRATDIATRIEMTDAKRARPNQTAESARRFPSRTPSGQQQAVGCSGARKRGQQKTRLTSGSLFFERLPPHVSTRQESSALAGGFGGLHPLTTNIGRSCEFDKSGRAGASIQPIAYAGMNPTIQSHSPASSMERSVIGTPAFA